MTTDIINANKEHDRDHLIIDHLLGDNQNRLRHILSVDDHAIVFITDKNK
jgi:hypothetical protein